MRYFARAFALLCVFNVLLLALKYERARREHAESEFARIVTTIDELHRQQRNAAVRRLKEVEAELAQRSADLRHARHELRMRDAEGVEGKVAGTPVIDCATAVPVADVPDSSTGSVRGRRRARGRAAVGCARRGIGVAGPIRGRATAARSGRRTGGDAVGGVVTATRSVAAPAGRHRRHRRGGRSPRSGARRALLLVDGYNISQAAWYQDPIARQRTRLVDALAELHARTGVEVEVVFDGADVDRIGDRPVRPAVRVRFSASGVEADDVLLELVDAARPAGR